MDANVLVPVKRIGVPDILVDHATPDESFAVLGLSSRQIVETVLQAFFKKELAVVK
jgi:1-deoxy-D-xylulose-5-phosphate synthase